MNRRIALCGLVAVAAGLSGVPARGAEMTFEQISWLDHTGAGYTSRYSDWGQVEITLTSADHGLFYPMTAQGVAGYGGFINIVTDAAGSADWEVRNLPIFYEDPLELDGRLPQGVWFDLGVSPGTPVTSLNYYFTVDAAPLGAMPSGTWSSKPVTELTQLLSGDNLWLGPVLLQGGGLTAPQPAMDFGGAESGEVIGWVGKISVPEKDVAAVDEDVNGCAPGSVARSLEYLSDAHDNVDVPDPAQQVYGDLRNAMHTTPAGTNTDDILNGKIDYTVSHDLPIMSAQTNSFEAAVDTLNRDGDVEIGVFWGFDAAGNSLGAHRAFVTEIQELQDADGNTTGYVVKTMDDPTQGDGAAENATHTLKFDAAGNLKQYDGKGAAHGAGLINFQVQDVRASLDSLELRYGPYSIYPLPPGTGLPNPIPVGLPGSPAKKGSVTMYYYGARDAGHPPNPVLSHLVVNPAGDPGPGRALQVDLAGVSFVPVDPAASTILAVGLSLGHLLPDDVTPGLLMPVLSEDGEVILTNLVATSSFFDVTYQVHMPGEGPQIFRLHGEVPEALRGKAWFLEMYTDDPDAWVESFFDVFFEVEVTPEAYALLGPDSTLVNMSLYGDQVPVPGTMSLALLGWALLLRRRR